MIDENDTLQDYKLLSMLNAVTIVLRLYKG